MHLEPVEKGVSSQENQFSRRSRIEAIQEMASAISFDLTDMAMVMGHKLASVEAGIAQNPKGKQLAEDLDKIKSTVERLKRMAKGMRSLGLLGNESELQLVPALEIMNQVTTLSKAWFQEQKIQFRCGDIPEVNVRCRPRQIAQALINLLNNAIEATGSTLADKKWVNLDFALEGSSPIRLKIIVTDSGKVSPEIKEKMMEPFFSTKPQGSGMGLGLNVVKSVAEAHAGKVYLDTLWPNTRFIFELPVSL